MLFTVPVWQGKPELLYCCSIPLVRCTNNISFRMGFVDEGFRFGRLGLQMFQQFNIQQYTGRVYAAYYGLLHDVKLPIRDSIGPLKYAYVVSLEKGDIEYAFLCGNICLWKQIEIEPLEKLHNDVQAQIKQMAIFCQFHNLEMLKGLHITIRNFLWRAKIDSSHPGEDLIVEKEYNDIKSPSSTMLGWSHINRLWIYYMFGNFEKAYFHANAAIATGLLTRNVATNDPFFLLLVGLADIENSRRLNTRRSKHARICIKLIKQLADHAPCNFLGKQFLLEAQLATLENKPKRALQKFTCAITLAKDGFIMETALGYELAAKALFQTGDLERANTFFEEAILVYRRWGSVPKTTHLLREIKTIMTCRRSR
jgi:tetratricopeptide (TPR) repeat protein